MTRGSGPPNATRERRAIGERPIVTDLGTAHLTRPALQSTSGLETKVALARVRRGRARAIGLSGHGRVSRPLTFSGGG